MKSKSLLADDRAHETELRAPARPGGCGDSAAAVVLSVKEKEFIANVRKESRKQKASRSWETMKQVADNGRGVFGGGPWVMLGISSHDGTARHDFRDFQRIKNDLVGKDWEAIELYPSEERLIDPSNYYMLWCAPKIPVGQHTDRVIVTAKTAIVYQRPFPKSEDVDEVPDSWPLKSKWKASNPNTGAGGEGAVAVREAAGVLEAGV